MTFSAYPTPMTDYVNTYEVAGAIETTDAANGQSTCISGELLSNGGATFALPSHPSLSFAGNSWGVDYSADPLGTLMTAIVSTASGDRSFFRSAFPDQVAFSSCGSHAIDFKPFPWEMESIIQGVAYLTVTSTTHTNAPPTPAKQYSAPPSTPNSSLLKGSARPPASPAQSPPDVPDVTGPAGVIPAIVNSGKPQTGTPPQTYSNPAATIIPVIVGGGSGRSPASKSAPASPQADPESVPVGPAAPKQATPEKAAPQQTVSEQAVPERPSEQATPQQAASQQSAPQLATPEHAAPGQVSTVPAVEPAASSAQFAPGNVSPMPSVVVGSTAIRVKTAASPTIIGGSSTAVPVFGVGSSTIVLGQTATISNTPVAFISSAGQTHAIIGGTSTIPLALPDNSALTRHDRVQPTNPAAPGPGPVTVGSQIFAPNSQAQYVGSGQTVGVGASITVGNGPSLTVVGLQTNAAGHTELIIGDSTSQIPSASDAVVAASPVLQAAGERATPNSNGQYVVAGQTLAPGSRIVVGGKSGAPATTIALQTNGAGQTAAIVNGQSTALALAPAPSPLVIGSQTVQPNPVGQFVVSGSTLTPGVVATFPGAAGAPPTTVALQTNSAGQTEAVVNGQTQSLSPTPTGAPLYVGGQTIYPNSQSQYVVSGRTLTSGAAATISGNNDAPPTTVSLTTNGAGRVEAVVNGKTSTLASLGGSYSRVPINIGGQEVYPNARSQYVVGGKTLTPGATITIPPSNGGPASTIALQTDNAGHTEAIINSHTSTINPASPITSAALVVGGQTMLPNSKGQYVISGKTLSPGSTITIPGANGGPSTTVALQTDSAGHVAAIMNGQTSNLTPSSPMTAAALIVGGETLLPNSAGSYVVSGHTLTPGSTITVPGDSPGAPSTTMALSTNGQGQTEAIVNGQTATLTPSAITAAPLVLSKGGETLLPNAAGDYVVDGKTLSLGAQITIPGNSPGAPSTTISLTTNAAGQTEAVMNGRTSTLTPFTASVTGAPVVVGGQTITPNAQGQYVINGQTLSLDGEITLGGGPSKTTVDLTTDAAGHTEVVVNGHTSTLSSSAASTGLGNYIMSGAAGSASGGSLRAGGKVECVFVLGMGALTGVLAVML